MEKRIVSQEQIEKKRKPRGEYRYTLAEIERFKNRKYRPARKKQTLEEEHAEEARKALVFLQNMDR